MDIIIVENAKQGAAKAFELFKTAYQKGAKHYGLATGSTPIELYTLIRESDLDFSDCYSINLDEYIGLAPDDEHSYGYFMEQHLFHAKPFKASFIPNGLQTDELAEISRYEAILKQYPIDLQILGLGTNAHIGFNEPGTSFHERTHKVKLADATIQANQRFFDQKEDVPTHAYSMGLQSIMDAKEIVLMAFGKNKAEAIKALVEGEITEQVPASILQQHPQVTIVIDKEAAMLLA